MIMNINIEPTEYRLCVKVAKLYYEENLTQNEIGNKLGYSRVKINRVLQRARELGIVQIVINAPDNEYFDYEHALMIKYNLRDAIVVPDVPDDESLYSALATGAAQWLKQILKTGMRVGLGLGRTISHLPQVFNLENQMDCTFTEIVGAASDHSGIVAKYNITSKMAEIAGGVAEFFYAPNYVSDSDLRTKLLREPSIAKAMSNAKQSDIVIQSIGTVDLSSLMVIHDYITEQDLQVLREKGAIGDALGHYFDRDGNEIRSFIDDRLIGLGLTDLKEIPWSVLVAGGEQKIEAVHAAMLGGYFNVLVTNAGTASVLLAKGEK
jgi:DNA-binding transcriptional regulator LsrR (DeoR family)